MRNKIRLLLIVALVPLITFIFYQRVPIWFTQVGMSQELLDRLDFTLVDEVKKIDIPQLRRPFNPGFIKFKERYLLMPRVDLRFKISFFKAFELLHHHQTQFHIMELDDNLHPIEGSLQPVHLPFEMQQAQDPRLFVLRDQLCVMFNMPIEPVSSSRWLLPPLDLHRRLYIGVVENIKGEYFIKNVRYLHYPDSSSHTEKNWTPFVHEEELYVIYSFDPYTILHVDQETGFCRTFFIDENGLPWKFGHLCGGTQAIELDDYYLTVFHAKLPVTEAYLNPGTCPIYLAGAYLFENRPPFRPVKISRQPFATQALYTVNNRKKIVFPSGIHVEGDRLYIASGKSDRYIEIYSLSLSQLIEAMTDKQDE